MLCSPRKEQASHLKLGMWRWALLPFPLSLCRIFQSFENLETKGWKATPPWLLLRVQRKSKNKAVSWRLWSFGCSQWTGRVFPFILLHPSFPASGGGEGKTLVFKKPAWGLENYIQMLYPDSPIWVLRVGGKYPVSPEEVHDGYCQSRHSQRIEEWGLAMK